MKLKDRILGSLVPGFDPALYPRTYPLAAGWRAYSYAIGAILVAGGLALAFNVLSSRATHPPAAVAVALGLCLLVAATGAFIVLDIRCWRLVLQPDAIEQHWLLGVRRLRRDEISGRRGMIAGRGSGPLLETRKGGAAKMRVPLEIDQDAAFRAWIATLPDLDLADRRAAENAVAADADLGATPLLRLARLAQARKTAALFNTAAILAALWAILYPRPYDLAMLVLALLPWAAIGLAALRPKLYSLELYRPLVAAPLLFALVTPGFGLVFSLPGDVHFLDWTTAVLPALGCGLLAGGIAVAVDARSRQRKAGAAVLVALMLAYGCGSILQFDHRADRVPAEIFRVRLLAKQIVQGHRYKGWQFTLAPWGPRPKASAVRVAPEVYAAVAVNDSVCLGLRPGAIGMPWYTVSRCP